MASSDLAGELNEIHTRLVNGSSTASRDLFLLALRPLKGFLANKHPSLTEDQHHDLATDAVLAYLADPTRFDPVQASLWSYLCMIAGADAVDLFRKEARQGQLLSDSAGDVEDWSSRANDVHEIETSIDARTIMSQHANRLATNDAERGVLNLLLEGERSTAAFARVLQLDPEGSETRGMVKLVKDRLLLRLRRLRDEL